MARLLTKQDQKGNRYGRPKKIETTIDEALTQDLTTLCQRADLNCCCPDRLPLECLVHLIRDAGRREDHHTMNTLIRPLLARCEAILCAKIPDDRFHNAAHLREEVLSEFSELFAIDLFDVNNNELDYFECQFNAAFRTFRIDFLRSEITRMKRVVSFTDLSDQDESDDLFPAILETVRSSERQEDIMIRKDFLKAVDSLPFDERRAVVFCIMGYEVESRDPEKMTVAKICGVTGRTIRNLINRAATRLQPYKGLLMKEDTLP